MSHQTTQRNTFVTITDINLLKRAVRAIQVPGLNTHLVLDTEKKEARYYGNMVDRDCFAVVTYARELTEEEKRSNYEIAVKKSTRDLNGVETTVYDLVADVNASDRSMREKIAKAFEEYQIAVVSSVAEAGGAISVREAPEEAPEGYRAIEIISGH